jgi:hypothetical protein
MKERKNKRFAADDDGGSQNWSGNDRLLDYLEGRMSEADRRVFEAGLSEAGPESDALDGLYGMTAGETAKHVKALNSRLSQHMRRGKKGRRRRQPPTYVVVAVLAVLLLAAAACLVAGKALHLF